MRTTRLYTPQPLAHGQDLQLDDAPAHHLAVVLRARQGQAVQLFNGDGRDYSAVITAIDRRCVQLRIEDSAPVATESPLHATLAIGVSRGERFDWVLQKATELGVSAIQPLWTERCAVRLDDRRQQKKHQHWQQILVSASEQSGRATLPDLHPALALDAWLARCDATLRLLLHPDIDSAARDAAAPARLALLVGPEGGFSDAEVAAARAAGFQGLRLGPRILRTETAPVAALTLAQSWWGDFI